MSPSTWTARAAPSPAICQQHHPAPDTKPAALISGLGDHHHPVSTTQADFTSFLDWLQQQAANGVTVQTVQQVIGGGVQPAVQGPPLPAAPYGSNPLRNGSLEENTLTGAAPDCTQLDHFGNNSFTWTRPTNAHSGSYAEQVSVTNYQDGDNKLLVQQDLGHCTPSVTPGHQYRLTTWPPADRVTR